MALNPSNDPGEFQPADLIQEAARRLGLAWFLTAPDSLGVGRRLVLGVAAWSIYDRRLLMYVSDAVSRGAQPDLLVSVFDADELLASQPLRDAFASVGEMFHTPVAGYWEDGALKEMASGFTARELVARLLGFDPKSGLAPGSE